MWIKQTTYKILVSGLSRFWWVDFVILRQSQACCLPHGWIKEELGTFHPYKRWVHMLGRLYRYLWFLCCWDHEHVYYSFLLWPSWLKAWPLSYNTECGHPAKIASQPIAWLPPVSNLFTQLASGGRFIFTGQTDVIVLARKQIFPKMWNYSLSMFQISKIVCWIAHWNYTHTAIMEQNAVQPFVSLVYNVHEIIIYSWMQQYLVTFLKVQCIMASPVTRIKSWHCTFLQTTDILNTYSFIHSFIHDMSW